ncbi:hypothetical protein [Robertmurraya sp. FSL R5-0851]|uniref:hypothetical protein n=1 Tax=Robertmurraya sp. FSL R5-0851 TaxID=2921584 RepID=UPI0030FC60AE
MSKNCYILLDGHTPPSIIEKEHLELIDFLKYQAIRKKYIIENIKLSGENINLEEIFTELKQLDNKGFNIIILFKSMILNLFNSLER